MFKSLVSRRNVTLVRVKIVSESATEERWNFSSCTFKNGNMKRGSARRYIYVCDFYLEVSDSNISIVIK
jgi:hypothetical protein